jgi:hypothetical protein
MAKPPVALDTQPEKVERARYAVFGLNSHFSIGLWELDAADLPVGHEAFMRPATEADISMARSLVKTLD